MIQSLILKLKVLGAFTALVRDPYKTEKIFKISDIARKRNAEKAELAVAHVLNDERFKILYRDHYNPMIDIRLLRSLPLGSFGNAVAQFLDKNRFNPSEFPLIDGDRPLDYLVSRIRQTHDLYHVLTGYGTGVPDELALQAFMIPQIGSLLSVMLIAGGLLHLILFKPMEAIRTFDRMIEGYILGKQSTPLVMIKLEEEWATDLEVLRRKLGLNSHRVHELITQSA